jgi:MiaB-like tRNA modifying enzyme
MKIFFRTFGCSTNLSETEVMKGLLKNAQFEIVKHYKDADVIVVNMCSVKTPAFRKAIKAIEIANKQKYKKLIIAGCIPKQSVKELRELAPDASLVNTNNMTEIVSVVEETINDNPIEALTNEPILKLNFPKVRRNPAVSVIPISNSCIDHCTYCSVKGVKGKFMSYPIKDILREVKKSVEDGCKEIWLTSQDNGCYGMDINTNIVELLKKVTRFPGGFKVRLGMMNPTHIKDIVNELAEVYKHDKMFKFIHLPIQSGNDDILKKMGRRYIVDEFKSIVNIFRETVPNITISTDIICGFPGETEEQFNDSINLIKEIKPDVLNRSRFWPRPGTPAAKFPDQLHGNITKERSRKLTSLFEYISFENNKKWKDWTGEIIIDEYGKDNTFVGRNFSYKPVIVSGDLALGDIVRVKVYKPTIFHLKADVIEL